MSLPPVDNNTIPSSYPTPTQSQSAPSSSIQLTDSDNEITSLGLTHIPSLTNDYSSPPISDLTDDDSHVEAPPSFESLFPTIEQTATSGSTQPPLLGSQEWGLLERAAWQDIFDQEVHMRPEHRMFSSAMTIAVDELQSQWHNSLLEVISAPSQMINLPLISPDIDITSSLFGVASTSSSVPPPVITESNFREYPYTVTHSGNRLRIQCTRFAPRMQADELITQIHGLILNPKTSGRLRSCFTRFIGERGVDHGALSRQFWATLFQGLIKQTDAHTCTFIKRANGCVLPHIRLDIMGDEDVFGPYVIGSVIGFLLGTKEYYPIGEVFDLQLFREIVKLNGEDFVIEEGRPSYPENLKNMGLPEFTHRCNDLIEDADRERFNDIRAIVEASSWGDLDQAKVQYYNDVLAWDLTEENFLEKKQGIFDDFKRPYIGILGAIFFIAHGLMDTLKVFTNGSDPKLAYLWPEIKIENWSDVTALSPQIMQDRLQGRLTKELFRESVRITTLTGISVPDEEAKAAEINGWFQKWIDTAELPQLRAFMASATGSPAFAGEVKFMVAKHINKPLIHACFRSIDMPYAVTEKGFLKIIKMMSSGEGMDETNAG